MHIDLKEQKWVLRIGLLCLVGGGLGFALLAPQLHQLYHDDAAEPRQCPAYLLQCSFLLIVVVGAGCALLAPQYRRVALLLFSFPLCCHSPEWFHGSRAPPSQ